MNREKVKNYTVASICHNKLEREFQAVPDEEAF